MRRLGHAEMKEIRSNTFVPEAIRIDSELLLVVGRLWGTKAPGRMRFAEREPADGTSKLGALLHSFRV